MITTIKKGATKDEIRSLFEKLTSESNIHNGFDAYKYCGSVKFNEDGLKFRKT